jgi:excisionase family DNA binding protein
MTSSTLRPEYISLQDAAALYAVSVDLLRERIRTGELPAVHAGRRLIRVRIDDLKRMFRPLPAARRYRQIA